jgi:cytoskeleton protein RodZ
MSIQAGAPRDLPIVRRKRGVSLEEIATATRIGVHHLQAIEDGDFAKLPGGVYNTSFIRQYAQAIGYDESDLIEEYRRAAGLDLQEPAPVPPRRSLSQLVRIALAHR